MLIRLNSHLRILCLHVLAFLFIASCSGGDATPGVDASSQPMCEPQTGPATVHPSLQGDETWTAAGSPHLIETNLSISIGQTLTIEPCAVIQLAGGVGMIVEGSLVAIGAADQPIRIERANASLAWASIEARAGSDLHLTHVTVDGGGDSNGGRITQYGALDIRGDQDLPTQPILLADTLSVTNSLSLGILVREGGGFAPGSKDLTVSGSAAFPISVWGRAVGTVPTGTYTGNAADEILLPASPGREDIKEDTTIFARGVPYLIGGPTGGNNLHVSGAGGAALLTIEPGVTLRFSKDVRLEIDAESATGPALGALRAEGTASAPIIFTSAEIDPAEGDWVGIVIGGLPDSRNKIANATINFAGGASQSSSFDCPSPANPGFSNDGAIVVLGVAPASAFVSNTLIGNSAGDGIVRGWTGDPVDLTATNTFTNIARCNQSFPRPLVGGCPDPAPCPK